MYSINDLWLTYDCLASFHNAETMPSATLYLYPPNFRYQDAWFVPPEGLAVGPDQELLEVPGDVTALHRWPDDELGVADEGGGVVGRQRQGRLQVLQTDRGGGGGHVIKHAE